MLVQNTIYKIIYMFFKIILLFYHFLCNLCLSHVAATLRNSYCFQVISILFSDQNITCLVQNSCARPSCSESWKKSILNVFLFRNNVRFVQVFQWVF